MVREPHATVQPTLQDNQLMSKHRVLSFKPQLRLEWRGQDGQSETEQPDHSASLGDSITLSTQIGFSVHTGRRKSRCSNYGHLVRRAERVGVVHCADLSLRGRGKRILPDGANIAAIAPVSWRLYRKPSQLTPGGGFLLGLTAQDLGSRWRDKLSLFRIERVVDRALKGRRIASSLVLSMPSAIRRIGWLRQILSPRSFARAQECSRRSVPIYWPARSPARCGAAAFWRLQSRT